jgi:sugar O-acyltransferase (sialic acid O-acetyltransferase NeuD family)
MTKLIVIGALTPTIIRVINDINDSKKDQFEILGFIDNDSKKKGNDFFGYKILGDFEKIKQYNKNDVCLINTIASSTSIRKEVANYFINLGYKFTNIIHPRVNLGNVTVGIGNLIYENVLIQPFVNIGNHCIISSNSGIAHETSIGDYVFIGPSSYICGKVIIKDEVYIGTGAKILPRLSVGSQAIIGACSLVNKNVPSNKKIIGIPGRSK